jgi:hypothetical protein
LNKKPVKKPKTFVTPVVKINNVNYIPITKQPVKKVVVEGVTYVPVKLAPKKVDNTRVITP